MAEAAAGGDGDGGASEPAPGGASEPAPAPARRTSARLRDRVCNVAYAEYDAEERQFYRLAPRSTRRRIADEEQRMRELNQVHVPLRFRVLLSEVDERVKATALQKVQSLCSMDPGAGEYHKLLHWVEALCRLPVGRYRALPVSAASPRAEVAAFLRGMRERLDAEVYGHADAKGHIVRLLAQWVTNPAAKGLVVGLQGEMGTGKTSLCKAVCRVLGLPFAFLPLGGASDGCYLDGHSFTYEGAVWGRVADALMQCGCMNPVLFFDELDKVSESHRGREVVNLLIHLTDASQNDRFCDKYFGGVDLDLSRCLVIFSYNDEAGVSPVLRDRMTRVHTEGYSLRDKLAIARGHLVPAVLAEFALAPGDVVIADGLLQHMVDLVEEERGVRNLRRAIVDVVSHLNLERLVAGDAQGGAQLPIVVTREMVDRCVRAGRRGCGPGGAGVHRSMYS